MKNGFPRQKVQELFDNIRKFAEYCFNKSHSAAYGYLAYITAYLKAHYPVEYFAALMNASFNRPDDIVKYLNAAREMGIRILPPDVNRSLDRFTVEGDAIRFGLAGIKNVGFNAVEEILRCREEGEFKDIVDFASRVDSRKVNKRVLESLIKAGAFDFSGYKRAQMMAALDHIVEVFSRGHTNQHQISMFSPDSVKPRVEIPEMEEWPEPVLLKYEKEVTGFYVSSHPLEKQWRKIRPYITTTADELSHGRVRSEEVIVAGIATGFASRKSKKGTPVGSLILEDVTGFVEVFMFEDTLKKLPEKIEDQVLIIKGRVDSHTEGKARIVALEVYPFNEARRRFAKSVHIRINTVGLSEDDVEKVRGILMEHKGRIKVFLYLRYPSGFEAVLALPDEFGVSFSESLIERFKKEYSAEVFYSG